MCEIKLSNASIISISHCIFSPTECNYGMNKTDNTETHS